MIEMKKKAVAWEKWALAQGILVPQIKSNRYQMCELLIYGKNRYKHINHANESVCQSIKANEHFSINDFGRPQTFFSFYPSRYSSIFSNYSSQSI